MYNCREFFVNLSCTDSYLCGRSDWEFHGNLCWFQWIWRVEGKRRRVLCCILGMREGKKRLKYRVIGGGMC